MSPLVAEPDLYGDSQPYPNSGNSDSVRSRLPSRRNAFMMGELHRSAHFLRVDEFAPGMSDRPLTAGTLSRHPLSISIESDIIPHNSYEQQS